MIYLIPILALVILVADFRVSCTNMNVPWNGYGAVKQVVKGVSLKPMQYRVLVPWLTYLLGGTVKAYMFVKYGGVLLMLYGFHWYLGVLGANQAMGVLALCAFIPITYLYDYADAYYELGFLSLAFGLVISGGSLWLILVIVFMGTLNRETMIIILPFLLGMVGINAVPVTLYSMYLLIASVIFALSAGFILPRLLYGKKQRYCNPIQLGANLKDVIRTWSDPLEGIVHALILIVGFFCAIIMARTAFGFILIVLLIWLTSALFMVLVMVPGKWREVRIFLPLSLAMIPLGVG